MPNPSGLCKCGCGQKTRLAVATNTRYRWVKGEPLDFVYRHQVPFKKPPGFDVVGLGYETECWMWTGTLNNGYPMLGKQKAHRVFYEEAHGRLQPNMDVHHRCQNPACVNPDHLEAMSHDLHRWLRHSPISKELAEEIKRAAGTQRAIAARFGVGKTTVARIKNGEWRPLLSNLTP